MTRVPNPPLIENLLNSAAYDHPAGPFQLTETHCAWVVLTGEFAYKIKKPVNFGFLDFSTLEKRRFFCEEEVRLNRRFAPELYLGVVAITGTPERPRIGGGGPVLEYAVRMRQFPAQGLLSLLAAQNRLETGHIDQMIVAIADFHSTAQRAPADSGFGAADRIHHWVVENFAHIRPCLGSRAELDQLARVQQWTETEYRRLTALFKARKSNGFIRECHGDLHLGNLTLIDDRVTLFDCLEFNPELRWIDVISEVAFLVMDLEDRGYPGFAHRFLNGYLQQTGDYDGLELLRYYGVYRALVRAKVAMLRRGQAAADSDEFAQAHADYSQYMQLTERTIQPARPVLLLTYGLSGSGKSTLARQLCESQGMLQIRSDVERKRLSGLAATAKTRSGVGEDLYTPGQTERTYRRIAELAAAVLKAGYPVIADATFLQRRYRELFRQLAAQHRVPFAILDCQATDEELERRITLREAVGRDPSEATLEVLQAQRTSREPLDSEELSDSIRVDSLTVSEQELRQRVERLRLRGSRTGAKGES